MSEGKKTPYILQKQQSMVSFSKNELDDEGLYESSFTDDLDIKKRKAS